MATETLSKGGRIEVRVTCDAGCGSGETFSLDPGTGLPHLAANNAAGKAGWRWDGRGRRLCPRCWAGSKHRQPGRGGFTLVELAVVLAIIAIVTVAAAQAVPWALEAYRLDGAARLVQGQAVATAARAELRGAAGLRFLADPAYPIRRLADGSIDPTAPLAYDRVVPLEAAPGYTTGLVAVRGPKEGYPGGYVPAPNRLVLEQEPLDAAGLRTEPTAWAWNVRCGDRVELLGRMYTVCGPVAIAPAAGNPELFVTYSPTWPTLDRGDGPVEWLYLVDERDDDGDGWVDNGWDGLDNNYDGLVDDDLEWSEVEAWGAGASGLRRGEYRLHRRPVPGPASSGVQLAGVAIDATGWASSPPARSGLVVDRWTGAADLLFDSSGRVEPSRPVARPSGVRWHHLWIAPRESIDPAVPAGMGRLVSIDARTGRAATGDADPTDPAGSRRKMEGGGL